MAFGFTSIEHAFASVAKAIGKGFQVVEKDIISAIPKIETIAAEVQPVVQVVLTDLAPAAVTVENAAYAFLGKMLAAIDKTAADGQQLTAANVLANVSVVDTEITDLKGIAATVKSGLVDIGVIKTATQTLAPPTK